ncbi:MAG: SpoIID/LytB domain-containing protein [Magnetococcales bacterium]|nr:SpoIID/LytB domain-containing protein [Magnetococcales bacterium]
MNSFLQILFRPKQLSVWLIISSLLFSPFFNMAWAANTEFEDNPESIAQFNINVGSLAMDERQYLDALSYFEQAFETSKLDKTKVKALQYMATTFASFLDSTDSALKIYEQIQKDYPKFAQSAYYKEILLLFENERYPEVLEKIRQYSSSYPNGRFQFQAELLGDESRKAMGTEAYKQELAKQKAVQAEEMAMQALLTKKDALAKSAVLLQASKKIHTIASSGFKKITEPVVRVLFTKGSPKVRVEGDGLVFKSRDNSTMLRSGIEVNSRGGQLIVNGSKVGRDIKITANSPINVVYGKNMKKSKRVRGYIMLAATKSGVRIINHVKIEDYLLGVVPAESPPSWKADALKSQTLAARTYAYNDVRKHAKDDFDVYDSIRSQVYGGIGKEHKNTTRAIRATRGEIITAVRKGKLQPILAMFAANSGGYTADPQKEYSTRWDKSHYYLTAHKDPWSTKSGKAGLARWEYTHSRKEIEKNLAKRKVWIKNLESIKPVYTGPSGRVVKVRLLYDGGKSKTIRFRPKVTLGLAGRIGTLPDTIVDIKKRGDKFVFTGKGFGHGIGYMQWGGQYMAKAGHSYRDILEFYYPGTNIMQYW